VFNYLDLVIFAEQIANAPQRKQTQCRRCWRHLFISQTVKIFDKPILYSQKWD